MPDPTLIMNHSNDDLLAMDGNSTLFQSDHATDGQSRATFYSNSSSDLASADDANGHGPPNGHFPTSPPLSTRSIASSGINMGILQEISISINNLSRVVSENAARAEKEREEDFERARLLREKERAEDHQKICVFHEKQRAEAAILHQKERREDMERHERERKEDRELQLELARMRYQGSGAMDGQHD